MDILTSDMLPFHGLSLKTGTETSFVSNLVLSFILYEKIYVVTSNLDEIDLLQSFIEHATLKKLISSKRIEFIFEPQWGVWWDNTMMNLPIDWEQWGGRRPYRDRGDGIGYGWRGPQFDQIAWIARKSKNSIKEMACENLNGNLSSFEDIEAYVELAKSTDYEWSPSQDDTQWYIDPYITVRHRAFLIRDLVLARKVDSHIDLDFKARWWSLKSDIDYNILNGMTGEDFRRGFKYIREVLGLPDFESLIRSNKLSPNKIVKDSMTDAAKQFRKWFSDFFHQNQNDLEILRGLTKELWSLLHIRKTKTDILKWGLLNLVSLLPGAGPAISAALGMADIIRERAHLVWKPIMFLKKYSSKQ